MQQPKFLHQLTQDGLYADLDQYNQFLSNGLSML